MKVNKILDVILTPIGFFTGMFMVVNDFNIYSIIATILFLPFTITHTAIENFPVKFKVINLISITIFFTLGCTL